MFKLFKILYFIFHDFLSGLVNQIQMEAYPACNVKINNDIHFLNWILSNMSYSIIVDFFISLYIK